MKRLLRGALGLIALLGATGGATRLWLGAEVPPLGGREPVAGLRDSVVVLWDSLGVPHIAARDEEDLFTAIGYLHARDRMWEMDLLRHAALGRLSELFGARTVGADRALRTLELGRIAAAQLGITRSEERRILEAYAHGVNAWLAQGRYHAVEFRMIRHAAEPWRPEHSLAIGRLEAWDLRTTGDELELGDVAAQLGPDRAAQLAPTYPDTAPTIVPRGEWRAGRDVGSQHAAPLRSAPSLSFRTVSRRAHASAWEPDEPGFDDKRGFDGRAPASNAWVLGPSRTASHKPILANDPHLTLRAPSIWYLVGAHAPGYEVVGATIPGIPIVVLGHNARLGWGFTNAMVDDVDYVAEELSPDSTRYRTPGGWARTEVVAETIFVHGGTPLVYRRLRTADGPVIERAGREPGPPLAMRWVAHDPTDEIGALRAMGRATDLPSFEAAVAGFRSPEQNVVYADAAGNIAYFLAGHVPVRRGGAGLGPASGWATAGRWDGYLAAAELPRMVNPAQAYIVTANNRVIGDEYPFYISREWELPYRAERILELVRRDSAATAGSVARAQLDIVDVFCRAIAPLAARAAAAAGRPDVAAGLRAWDGAMSPDRTEPTLVWSWYRELQRLVYDSVSPGYRPAEPLHRWLARGRGPWNDLSALERQAMATVLPQAAGRPWRSVHATVQEHPLSAVPLLGRLLRFNVGPLVTPGGNYTVNVASTDEFAAPFASTWGPSMRHVVDFGDVDGAGGFILPTGQSGYPLSPHYRDQTTRWLKGQLWILPLDLRRVRSVSRLVLVPDGRERR